MKRSAYKSILFIAALSIVAFISACVKDRSLTIGESVPEISAIDLNDKTVKLSDFEGKVVVLRFWASGCRACVAEMPALEAYYKKYKEMGLVVVAVNRGDSRQRVADFIEDLKISYPVLLDPVLITQKKYGVTAVPTTYFIDRTGVLRKTVFGPAPLESLEKIVRELL